MYVDVIRDLIDRAVARERSDGEFQRRLEPELAGLGQRLLLPEERADEALVAFVIEYVLAVPDALELVYDTGQRLGFHEYAAPFIYLAQDFFLHPVEFSPDGGLESILQEAFLAHRLLEEVNDHHVRQLQRPLLPVDMTEANIIVHHLLGDERASRLDKVVAAAAEHQLQKHAAWTGLRDLPTTAGDDPALYPDVSTLPAPRQVRLRLAG